MTDEINPLLEESIEIDAPPAKVWGLVSDLPRMAEWSPQVWRSFVRTDGPLREGSRLLNINRRGLLVWPTRSKVVTFTPEREIAFRIKDNKAIWSFELTPTPAGGTRVVQKRTTPDGLSDISMRLTQVVFGGQQKFGDELTLGMHETLAKIKAESEK